MSNNTNQIITNTWSNPSSEALYKSQWENALAYRELYENGEQCGGCSFYAKFNADWGLCSFQKSTHYLETVFEHFTCPVTVQEGWGSHSFTENREFQNR